MAGLSSASALATTFPASITSRINYLPADYPVQWSSNGHGTYLSHAQSCWTAWTDWRSASSSWSSSVKAANISVRTVQADTTITFYIPTSTTVYPTTSVSLYTLCDGFPRATVSPVTSHYIHTLVETRPSVATLAPTAFPSSPCTPNAEDCAVYYFQSNLGYYNASTDIISDLSGACGLPVDWPSPCIIQGGPAELLYFPVTTPSADDACRTSATSPTPTTSPAAPPTLLTTLGHTFDPASAYISFATLYAGYRSYDVPGGAGIQVGPTFRDQIFSFASSEISTNCFGTIDPRATTTAGYGLGTALDFADLAAPVPASAYRCQNQCRPCSVSFWAQGRSSATICSTPNPCATIWENFNPLLAVPTRLRDLVPEWRTCHFWDDRIANLVFDPPYALQLGATVDPAVLPPGAMETSRGGAPSEVSASATTTMTAGSAVAASEVGSAGGATASTTTTPAAAVGAQTSLTGPSATLTPTKATGGGSSEPTASTTTRTSHGQRRFRLPSLRELLGLGLVVAIGGIGMIG